MCGKSCHLLRAIPISLLITCQLGHSASATLKIVMLGRTGLRVSALSIGTDYRHIYGRPEIGSPILRRGLELGVNFWDTSDDYGAHPSIREALKDLDRSRVVIASKTFGIRGSEVRESLERSFREMGVDYIDIYMLHAVDEPDEIRRRSSAIEAMLDAKRRGLIRAIGLSTHAASVAREAAHLREIDVVLAVANRTGARISEGTLAEMLDALRQLYEAGKGVCIMKPLGRGALSGNVKEALTYVLTIPHVHSVSVGITNLKELEADVRIAEKAACAKCT